MTASTKLPDSITKLMNFTWAPNETGLYVTKTGHGLGLIAHRDYGAFSIAWALRGQQRLIGGTKTDHLAAVGTFALQECANKQVIQGATLGDWITLHDPAEFGKWLKGARKYLEPTVRNRLDCALVAFRITNA